MSPYYMQKNEGGFITLSQNSYAHHKAMRLSLLLYIPKLSSMAYLQVQERNKEGVVELIARPFLIASTSVATVSPFACKVR